MVYLIILAFLILSYLFYVKVINVFCFHEVIQWHDIVSEKREDQIIGLLSAPDFSSQVPSYYSSYYILLKDEKEWIPVEYNSYKSIFINQKIKIVIKYDYYVKRSGFLWKNSDLVIKKEIKLKE